MNITKYIQQAQQYASLSNFGEYKIGAIIVKGGKVLSRGHNKSSGKIHTFNVKYNMDLWSLHAEMEAILNCKDARGATIFVGGEKRNGNPINCKPCKNCMIILKHSGIKNVFYLNRKHVLEITL